MKTPSRAARAATVLVLLAVSVVAASARSSSAGFDGERVEELARFFAEESVRRLRIPWVLRLVYGGGGEKEEELEKIRRDPPRLDAHNAAYPFGDKNPLSFVLDEERRALSCHFRIARKNGVVGGWGLTGPEMAAVLNAESSRRQRGDADWAYDPIRDAVGLRRDFAEPPTDRERFYREVDRLMKAGTSWSEGRFVDLLVPLVEARKPPPTASASADGFGATLVLRHFTVDKDGGAHFAERYLRGWDRPWGHRAPRLVSDRELEREQVMYAYVHFEGAGSEPGGDAAVDGTLEILRPDGSAAAGALQVPLWRGEAPPPGHLQIGANNVSFALDSSEPLGAWIVEATVCESGRRRCVELSHPFRLIAGER